MPELIFEQTNIKKKKKFNLIWIVLIPIILFLLVFGSRMGIYAISNIDYFKYLNENLSNIPILVNAHYDEKENLFYEQLNDNEKIAYQDLYIGCLNKQSKIYIYHNVSFDEVKKAILALNAYYPEIYCVNYTFTYQQNLFGHILVEFSVICDDAVDLNSYLKEYDSDYEKALYVHNLVIDKLTYDLNCENGQDYRSALYTDNAVCAGYASLYQMLAKKMGLECYYIVGEAINNGKKTGHAWNLVKVDDAYYWIDPTWDDSNLRYDFFLVDDETIFKQHIIDEQFCYPTCSDELMNNEYLKKGDLVIDDLNINELMKQIKEKLKTIGSVTIHFKETEQCDIMYTLLFNNGGKNLKEAIRTFLTTSFSYNYSRENNCLRIILN